MAEVRQLRANAQSFREHAVVSLCDEVLGNQPKERGAQKVKRPRELDGRPVLSGTKAVEITTKGRGVWCTKCATNLLASEAVITTHWRKEHRVGPTPEEVAVVLTNFSANNEQQERIRQYLDPKSKRPVAWRRRASGGPTVIDARKGIRKAVADVAANHPRGRLIGSTQVITYRAPNNHATWATKRGKRR